MTKNKVSVPTTPIHQNLTTTTRTTTEGPKLNPIQKKGPRYKSDGSGNSGYVSEEDPTSPKRSKRDDKGDIDLDKKDNPKTREEEGIATN